MEFSLLLWLKMFMIMLTLEDLEYTSYLDIIVILLFSTE